MNEFINAPENYQEVLYWKLTTNTKVLIAVNILSIPLLIIAVVLFFGWAVLWRPDASELFGGSSGLATILGIILVLVLHELTHGLAMQRYGAKPQYGILWTGLMFYATSPGYAFRRNNYLVIALAPLVAISILSLILLTLPLGGGAIAAIAFCAAINAAGAVGDMWITGIVLRYPPHAYIVDEKDGMRVLMPINEQKTATNNGNPAA